MHVKSGHLYRILYLSDGLDFDEEDLSLVKAFWERHKNEKNIGLRCYLKCKHPRLYRFLWMQRKRFREIGISVKKRIG